MGHVFISYSRLDQELVDKLIGVLTHDGIKVWVDREGIPGGAKWRSQIVEAIEAADAVLLALSPNSVNSDNVRKELDLTEEFKKTILPVEIKATPIPKDMSYQLVGLQRIDLATDFDAGVRRLLNALRLRANDASSADKTTEAPITGNPPLIGPTTSGTPPPQDSRVTSAESQYQHGLELYSAGNHALALRWLRKSAERGYAPAQNAVGVLYTRGEGTVADYYEAVKWFRCAAEQEDPWAYLNLGYQYKWGQGVPVDMSQAARYLRKAAEAGLAQAQDSLGVLYLIGKGVETDYREAAKWYRRAADQGYENAMANLAELYEKGLGMPQDQAEAEKWQRKRAEQREKDKANVSTSPRQTLKT